MNLVHSRKRTALRWIGLFILLAVVYSPLDALADFQLLTQKSVTLVGSSPLSTKVILRETPPDSLDTDTIRFYLTGDSDFSLETTSPLAYQLNAMIDIEYDGDPGDTSVAWLVVWDDDRMDTIELTGIQSSSGTPSMAIMIRPYEGMGADDTLCQTATIVNYNNFPVTVTGVVYYPYQGWHFPGIDLPQVLDPGDTLYVEICYIPYDSVYKHIDSVGFSFTGGGMQWNDVRGVPVEVGQCLSLSTRRLNFEYLNVGDRDTAQFTITNESNEVITVNAVDFYGDANNTYTFHGLPAVIPANESVTIDVEVEVEVSGFAYKQWTLKRTDDDCSQIVMSSTLSRQNVGHCFDVIWDSTTVGPIFIGNDTTISFTFVNTSEEEREIYLNPSQGDSIATYSWSNSWPIVLQPGDSVTVELTIEGDDIGNYRHGISFYSPSDTTSCDGYAAYVEGSVISNSVLPQEDIFSNVDGIDIHTANAKLEYAFKLTNNSGSPIAIMELMHSNSENFEFIKMPILTAVLKPDEGLVIRLGFEAQQDGVYRDTLWVVFDDHGYVLIPIEVNLAAASVGTADNVVTLDVWPNPASKQINVAMTNAQSAMLTVTDMLGRMVYHGTVETNTTIDLTSLGLTTGNYIVRASGIALSGAPFVHSTMVSVQ